MTDRINSEVVGNIDETLLKYAPKKITSRIKSKICDETSWKVENEQTEEKAAGENNTGDGDVVCVLLTL